MSGGLLIGLIASFVVVVALSAVVFAALIYGAEDHGDEMADAHGDVPAPVKGEGR